jgi:superfamily II DNA or RNA helicase
LHPLGDLRLTAREREDYERGKRFSADEAARLVSEVLPDLESRLPVDRLTRRLPGTQRHPPRIVLQTSREGDALVVLPLLVYGSPPTARVDAGRLVPLGGPLPVRDEAAEARLVRRLERELQLAPGHRERVTGERALDLAARLSGFEDGLEGRAHEAFFRTPMLEVRLDITNDDFTIEFGSRLDAGERRMPAGGAASVLRAWRDGESLVPLVGGGFAPLPADWLARHGARVADLLAAKAARGALPRAALPDLAALCAETGTRPPPGFTRLRALIEDFDGIPEASLPPDLTAELRPYQRRGVAWLCFLRDAGLGALLADDMGLGKTLQALCALPASSDTVRRRTLVVAPTSVVHNWAAEIARFRPALRVCLYHGVKRALDPAADVVLTTYALLRLDTEHLCDTTFDAAILDESQQIKNPDSQVARAAHRLSAGFRVAITGTPVENRLDELWSQMEFANPGLLGSRTDFEQRFSRPIDAGDTTTVTRLRERLRPFVLRRRKRDVAPELPPRTDVVLGFELDAEERGVYDAVHAATRREVVARLAEGGNVLLALEALLRLRQAACHAALVPGQHATRSSKLDLLRDELENVVADGHRALVFSQWTSLLDLAEPLLAEANIEYLRLDGSTRDRAGVVARFQDESGPPVLLVSLRAGGTGLNLTAADHVFLLDPWWNPAVEDQAADRAHRIGQERPVVVYRMVAKDTVEERILALQSRKRALGEMALGDADAASRLSRDDLLSLLE